ncbi:GerAB/ArcD/ProY family transporter [Bacillus nitroreducens]
MEHSRGKIGIREYVAIVVLVVGSKLSDDTPSIFVGYLDSAFWMAPILIGILSIIPIYFTLTVITSYKNKNLHDMIIHLFGKYFGTLLSIVLILVLTTALITDSALYVDIIGTMYFSQTPILFIYLLMMIICAYGAKKGIEQIGTVSWLVFFYIQFTLILAIILAFNESSPAYIFPILGPGYWEVIKTSTSHVSMFGDFFYFGLIAPYITSEKAFKKGTWIAFVAVIFYITFSFLAYLFVFDYEGLKMIDYPYQELIRLIRLGFLTNIETFFFPFWLIASFIRFSVYLYLIVVFIGGVCNIKQFEYLAPILASIVVIFGMAPEAPSFTIFSMREALLGLASPLFFFIPSIMWIIAKLKGDLTYDNKTSKDN